MCLRLGKIQPLSSFRTVPCRIFLLLQIFDTGPVRMYCLLFQFLCLSHFHSYHLLYCISLKKKWKVCTVPRVFPANNALFPSSFLSLLFIWSYFVLRSNCFKEFTLQTFLQGWSFYPKSFDGYVNILAIYYWLLPKYTHILVSPHTFELLNYLKTTSQEISSKKSWLVSCYQTKIT